MLTNSAPAGGYTGAAYEGVGLLPWIGSKISFILQPLFGFSNPEAIAVPITALGAAGAAIGMAAGYAAREMGGVSTRQVKNQAKRAVRAMEQAADRLS